MSDSASCSRAGSVRQRGSAGRRSLSLEENHDLRGAEAPRTPHREGANDPPALRRIAVERVLEVVWTELAAPPAVLLRQHFVFHGLSTSSKRRRPTDGAGLVGASAGAPAAAQVG